MRCGRCGNENSEGNRFCGMCGANLVPKGRDCEPYSGQRCREAARIRGHEFFRGITRSHAAGKRREPSQVRAGESLAATWARPFPRKFLGR